MELALLHKSGIITTLPVSKQANPAFAQQKPNGKFRLLVDLRDNNNLISDDYKNNIHSVSTFVDAAQHMAAKKTLLQTGLFAGVALSTNGQPKISRIDSIQSRISNFRT